MRRQRIDSVSGALSVMSRATQQISPPSNIEMTDEDLSHFDSIIGECPRSEWSTHKIDVACFLAKAMTDLCREQALLRSEGAVITGSQGSAIANPRKSVVQMHAANITAYRRSLALHARAQGGNARDIGKRRAIAKEIEAGIDDDDDDLIARPH